MPNSIIKFEELNFLIESVSERINSSNLFMFTKTLFQKNHLTFDKDFKIIYSYMHYSKEYFIFYYKNRDIKTVELEYFKEYLDDNYNSLIFYKDYFFLFERNSLYYFQKINDDIEKSDINEYIKKRFNFLIDKTIYVDEKDFTKLKTTTLNQSIKLNYLKKFINLNIFYTIFIVVFTLPFLFGAYVNHKNNENYQNSVNELQNKINKKLMIKKEDYLYYKIANLFSILNEKKIKLLEMDYKNKKVNLIIQSIKKESFYSFFKSCKKLFVNRLIFKQKENLYEAEISFVFWKNWAYFK